MQFEIILIISTHRKNIGKKIHRLRSNNGKLQTIRKATRRIIKAKLYIFLYKSSRVEWKIGFNRIRVKNGSYKSIWHSSNQSKLCKSEELPMCPLLRYKCLWNSQIASYSRRTDENYEHYRALFLHCLAAYLSF